MRRHVAGCERSRKKRAIMCRLQAAGSAWLEDGNIHRSKVQRVRAGWSIRRQARRLFNIPRLSARYPDEQHSKR